MRFLKRHLLWLCAAVAVVVVGLIATGIAERLDAGERAETLGRSAPGSEPDKLAGPAENGEGGQSNGAAPKTKAPPPDLVPRARPVRLPTNVGSMRARTAAHAVRTVRRQLTAAARAAKGGDRKTELEAYENALFVIETDRLDPRRGDGPDIFADNHIDVARIQTRVRELKRDQR